MDRKKKGEYIGMLGALLVHVIFFALLILVTIAVSLPKEDDGGVPVMMGNTDAAGGDADPSLVEVDVLPAPPEPLAEAQPEEIAEQELMSQTEEETIIVKPKVTPKKEKPKVVKKAEVKKREVVKKPEKTPAEKATEARLLAEAKAEQERKSAEDAARKRVSGAFGKGAQMNGSKGTADSGTGVEGSRDGNSSTGARTGVGGYGTFNLGGRSIGEGGLPRPAYNVQEEGRVVVSITVNPAGQVIATSINRQTNTVNATLRKAAEDAAKKARFNSVDGINNQTGTITYYFNLR